MSKHDYGTGTIFKAGSDTLWIRYYVNGRAKTENTKTTDRKAARHLLQQRIYESKNGLAVDPAVTRKLTVADLYASLEREYKINGRKSLDDLKARWKLHLEPFFGYMRPGNVSTDMVDRYIDQRQQEDATNATINRELAVLKRAFSLGMECTPPKVQRVPHFNMLEENNTRKGFLDPGQYDKLARECATRGLWMRTAFELGYTYGWRHEEVLGLRVEQVSIADRTIRLNPGATKNDQAREVTTTPLLRQLLAECIRGKAADDPVLTWEDGGSVKDFRGAWYSACCNAGLGRMVCRSCEATVVERRCSNEQCALHNRKRKLRYKEKGYKGLIFHDLRRTAVRNMVRAGIPEKTAMQISGHKTRSIFDRYNIVNQADMKDAIDKLNRQRTVRVEQEIMQSGQSHQSATTRPN